MPSIEVSTFSLKHTFESAQPLTFYADYNETSDTLAYPYNSTMINLMHSGSDVKGTLHIVSRHGEAAKGEVRRRFRLDDGMKKIYRKINTDDYIAKTIESYKGMRLTLNDPWETTLVFIISQFNNVKRIRLITKNIVQRFGAEILDSAGRVVAKSFPTSADLMKGTEKDFAELGAGFRAKYIKKAAEYCTNNIKLGTLPAYKYEKLKAELMQIDGVGDKVADCIALMGYGNLNAFPIDVHVKRTMEKIYFKGRKKKLGEIQEFAKRRWDGYQGYAQQYLFHHARINRV